MGLLQKIFGTYSQRQIKRIQSLADKVEAKSEVYKAMSDEELRHVTTLLRSRLDDGETLEQILPDAFSAVREASDRVLGKRPFYVQILGGILLHQGRIAEMKTGEGKTLVATMPAYLNALTGKGVHIITVNDYLAKVGSEEMGRVYAFLGLKTGLVIHGQTPEEKRDAYLADITYGTNNEYGFDYLRDNMVLYKEKMMQRGHHFAIVDEVDSILIDEARTPLIISGQGDNSTPLYDLADRFARTLRRFVIKEVDSKADVDELTNEDYIVDEKAKSVTLTKNGIEKAEKYFHLENLSDPENSTINHHINQAIRAHGIMKNDVDYVVKEGQVIIVDGFTGRLMPGRRYNNGLHQAIEAKEHVKVEKESKTLATITFQNYFRMYQKLSGMTGTALTEQNEFREIYRLDVVEVPTNRPMIRKDQNDMVFSSVAGKYRAIVAQIKACYEKQQPVLVGTVSIEKSEQLSAMLRRAGVPHTVLNAKHHEKEAEIVAQAGKAGAVTIATNMAGRGTDIMLGGNAEFLAKNEMRRRGMEEGLIACATGTAPTEDTEILEARALFASLFERYKEEIAPEAKLVREAGGLYILGTERHESRRIDNQLRGRSGRQGDPGESRFFLSLEDDLMRLFGGDRLINMVNRFGFSEDTPINAKLLSNSIETAQKKIESNNFSRRKHVLDYDDVMNQQRKIIYDERGRVLDGRNLKDTIQKIIFDSIDENIALHLAGDDATLWHFDALRAKYLGMLTTEESFLYSEEKLGNLSAEDVANTLKAQALNLYTEKETLFGAEVFREVERVILLRNVDTAWMEHLDNMDELKEYVGLNSYAQRNPLVEYRIQGGGMFEDMNADIQEKTMRMVLTAMPRTESTQRVAVAKVTGESVAGKAPVKKAPVVHKTPKTGRNDPCPCGSGKKYKNCCGANPNRL